MLVNMDGFYRTSSDSKGNNAFLLMNPKSQLLYQCGSKLRLAWKIQNEWFPLIFGRPELSPQMTKCLNKLNDINN